MATFIKGTEWSLLTPLEWAASGFEIRFVEEREGRKTDSEIEKLIEENWKNRQAERRGKGLFVEEPWPKTGFRWHQLDLESRTLTVAVSPANWKAMQGTHYNPKFFEVMLARFNRQSRASLSLEQAHGEPEFRSFILPYLDGAVSQCSAIETAAGYPLGFRSVEVGVAPSVWHVPGGYLPGIGEGIYKSAVPEADGKPIVERKIFTLNAGSMTDNALVNLHKESGRRLNPKTTEVVYTGMIYESPNHSVQFLSVVRTDLDWFGTNWEHEQGKMKHYGLEDIPGLLNRPDALPGGILKGGQACLAVAYLREKGVGSIEKFLFLRSYEPHLSTNR